MLTHAPTFACAIEPLDELAGTYALENWESGLLSGAFFAGRRARSMPPYLSLSELSGRLKAEDVEGIAHAAALAVAHLYGGDPSGFTTPGWEVRIARPQPADLSPVV